MLLLAVTVVWALALALLGSTEAVMFLAPVLLLALPLAANRYVGEKIVVRAITRHRAPKPRASRSSAPPRARTVSLVPRGSTLIARFLAGRPPPALLIPNS